MDAAQPSKIQAPGHETVHVCHKCGWSFPNAHPSARHRRAHKKVCGTLEGYKLVDSNGSDDERHSDEDHKTPSPKVLERSINEKGSSAIGDKSTRSEDEVFADAATEFSESSPGVEERFVDAKKSAFKVESGAKDDSGSNHSVEDSAITDIIQLSSSSTNIYPMKNHEVPDSTTDQLAGTLQYQDNVATFGSVMSSVSVEESHIVLTNDSGTPSLDSYPVESEKPADGASCESATNSGEAVTESWLKDIGQQDSNSKGNQEVKLDSILQDILVKHCTNELTEAAPKLEEIDEQGAMSADVVFQSQEENTEELNHKISASDSHAEVESVKQSDASIDSAQINVGAVQVTDCSTFSYTVEGCDGKELNENVHVVSVPEDIHVLAHPEVMLEDFKDHKGVNLHQLPLDSCDRIYDNKDNLKNPVCEENSPSFQSKQSNEDSVVTCSVMPIFEEKRDDGGCQSAVKEVPSEGEVGEPEVTVSVDKDEVEVPAYAGLVEVQKRRSTEEVGPHDISKDSIQKSFPDASAEVISDVHFMDSSIKAKVNEPTNLLDVAEAGNCEKGTDENFHIAGTENSGGVVEDSIENIGKAHESSCNSSGFQVNSVTDSTKGNIVGDQEHLESEKCDVSMECSSGGVLEENVSAAKAMPVTELPSNLHEAQVTAENVTDGSSDKVPDTGYTHLGTVSESSLAGTGVPNIQESTNNNINSSNAPQIECVDGASRKSTESYHGEDVEVLHKVSELHIMKEPLVSPQITAAVEENYVGEIDGGISTIGTPETIQAEGDNVTAKQLFAAADISIDSCSRTDSLDAHWGSVSVLSVQSDVPTVNDAESFPSTDSLAPGGAAENANSKKLKVESGGQSADRSDGFDPPSFLTLVENGATTGQKVSGSEIKADQKMQQSTSASLQPGWFPSLTNVVNDSPGRKKNEEIIAKVTNWSSSGAGKQHIPLKSLISGEASLETRPKSPSPKDDDGGKTTTVNSILGRESPAAAQASAEQGAAREWNSPARYPSDMKGGKRKVKGRPIWAQFVCCSSVN